MDYELKYVIAICLIVKIAALSGEFSTAGEETENPEQSPSRTEESFPPLSAALESHARRQKPFDWDPGDGKFDSGKLGSLKAFAGSKKIKENQSFDTCEHKLELLESSLKWRDIRKTLRWLDRMLSSNQTSMQLCHRRKDPKKRFHAKIKHFQFQSKNKMPTDPELNWPWGNTKMTSHSNRNKMSRKERKHKHRSWKNRLRAEWRKREKLKNKRKESRFGKYFHKKNSPKFSPTNVLSLNTTIVNPNSEGEKTFFQRTENRGANNFKSHHLVSNSLIEQCEGVKCAEAKTNPKGKEKPKWGNVTGGKWSEKVKSRERGQEKKMPKQKPWPHFVYHRVSSNFLHPDTPNQNHRQSAYIAISVVTSSKPESTDNTDDV